MLECVFAPLFEIHALPLSRVHGVNFRCVRHWEPQLVHREAGIVFFRTERVFCTAFPLEFALRIWCPAIRLRKGRA